MLNVMFWNCVLMALVALAAWLATHYSEDNRNARRRACRCCSAPLLRPGGIYLPYAGHGFCLTCALATPLRGNTHEPR